MVISIWLIHFVFFNYYTIIINSILLRLVTLMRYRSFTKSFFQIIADLHRIIFQTNYIQFHISEIREVYLWINQIRWVFVSDDEQRSINEECLTTSMNDITIWIEGDLVMISVHLREKKEWEKNITSIFSCVVDFDSWIVRRSVHDLPVKMKYESDTSQFNFFRKTDNSNRNGKQQHDDKDDPIFPKRTFFLPETYFFLHVTENDPDVQDDT